MSLEEKKRKLERAEKYLDRVLEGLDKNERRGTDVYLPTGHPNLRNAARAFAELPIAQHRVNKLEKEIAELEAKEAKHEKEMPYWKVHDLRQEYDHAHAYDYLDKIQQDGEDHRKKDKGKKAKRKKAK